VNKVDFPLGVELLLRDGRPVVLTEFFEDRWWGRASNSNGKGWNAYSWNACGAFHSVPSETSSRDIVWTPPKRKAWIVWGIDFAPTMRCDTAETAADYAARCGGVVQEIEEP